MDFTSILVFLGIGLLAGLLAGLIMRGSGLGLACDLAAGVTGGLLGGILASLLGNFQSTDFIDYAGAAAGATILIMLAAPVKRRLK